MAEQLNCTTPQAGDQLLGLLATGRWRVHATVKTKGWLWNGTDIVSDPASSRLTIHLFGEFGRTREYLFTGQQADNLIIVLNKSNNAVKSEERRILEYLIGQTLEVGNITGSPD